MKNTKEKKAEILLIEDNEGDIRLLEECLKEDGFSCNLNVVQDGIEALDYIFNQNKDCVFTTPDIIILDLNLPKKNGLEVLEQIKSDEKSKKIPVIILTCSDSEGDIINSYNLHANCFITKPLNYTEYIKVIDAIKSFWFEICKLPLKS